MSDTKMNVQRLASIFCIFTLCPCTLWAAQDPEGNAPPLSLRLLITDYFDRGHRPQMVFLPWYTSTRHHHAITLPPFNH